MRKVTKRPRLEVARETLINLTLVIGGDGTSTVIGSTLKPRFCNTPSCPQPP